MNGKKYEIKSLEWHYSEYRGGHYSLQRVRGYYHVYARKGLWSATRLEPDDCVYKIAECLKSIEEAKIACEKFHIESMEELLTEVKE